ncbi:glycosyl hydrolase [Cohnella sp. 56]|uniref:glycosyl hydrolase n=1 Tax=Cohnella sp. 56 TaxID=3113722 RepID=UPI0030E78D53
MFANPLAGRVAAETPGEASADAAALSVTAAAYPQSNLGLLGPEFKLVLDNFDAADAAKYSRNPGASGSVSFADSPLGADYGKALQFNYDLAQGYNGIILRRDIGSALPQNGAWPGLAAIELTIQSSASIPNPILQLNIGDAWPGTSYEADLKKHPGFDANSTAVQHLVVPIAEFTAKGGTTPIPATDNVISFAMYLGGSGTGTVTLDEAKLIFARDTAVDSFDGYADDAALAAAWTSNASGGANTRMLTAAGAGKAMTFAYDAASFNSKGYTGAVKSLAGQDWTGTGAIALDFTGDGLGQDILLQLTSGASSSMEAHLATVPGFDPTSTATQHLIIPVAMFAPKSSGMTLALDQMKGIALYVNKTGAGIAASSALKLDNIVRLVPYAQQAGGGEVKFNATSLTAQGGDNLLSVLNANATVSDGGRIVGVKYESSKPEILAGANGGYVYKGLFRQAGTVRVKLQSVQAEINGTVKEIAVSGDITIDVTGVNPAVDVLDYLKGQRGNGLLTAMHNKEPNTNPRETTDKLLARTGVTPAIWSGDFLYQARDVNARQTMIDEAIRQWHDGALVNIMLHVAPPNRTVEQEKLGAKWDDRTATSDQNGVQAYLSEAQWDSLLTEGGELNKNWKQRLDEYYRYLIQLKQAGVTAMFRPFHEMNQHVFWWAGNPEHTKALYRLTHDYLVDVKGLDNLIWVWDVQDLPANYGDSYGYNAGDWSSFNPGEAYWDVFALDVYDAKGYTQANYDQAKAVAGDKPMAIGECWVLPTQQELAAQPDWVFAMPWAGDTFDYNSAEKIKTFYQSNLTLADTPAFQTRRVGTIAVDDFESYADSAALTAAYKRDTTGGTNSVALQASPLGGSGKQAFAMTYNTNGPDGYTGTSRALNLDITGAKTIKLWFQGNGNSGQTVLIRLASGAPDRWFEFDLLDLRGYSATAKTPQYLEIPIEAFKPLAAGTTFDPSKLLGLGFYVKKLGGENRSGMLLFDGVSYSKLAPAKEAPAFKIDFSATDWQATGSDTLIKLLKANTSITALGAGTTGAAPYIFQVLYDSSDDGMLKNEGLFSSKGIFRKAGTVEVTIKQVTVYAGNKQYYIDVNRKVKIEVGNLAEPVNVLAYLKALTGNGTLSAMHNKEPNERPRITTDRIMETTGVTPAIWSGDFLFLKDDVANRQRMIDEAIRQWNDGALINIMFHVPSATRTVEQEKQGADWSGSANAVQTDLTAEQWTSLLTEGGDLNKNWKLRLDEYAKYLQQLKDAGVVPMVRPFHEMNQHAFWWAGVPQNTAALYRLTKDYLVNVKGLDNMIWMWNVQDFDNRMNWQDYNPGNDYWDILTLDAYTNGLGSKGDDYYAQMKKFAAEAGGAAGPKPIGIGESFKLLDTAGLSKYKDYAMMMPWADDAWVYNTDDALRTFYKNTVSLLDTPVFSSARTGGGPVEPVKYKTALDDFSGYADSEQLSGIYARNTNGGQNTATLTASPFGAGLGNAMKFDYTYTNGYSGRSRTVNGYWPGLEAVELWVQTDGTGQDILLQLSDGASYEAHLNNVAGFDKTSTAPQHLVIPIAEFKRKEGSGTINLKGITSFALYANQVGSATGGSITLDEIQLVFGEKPVLPAISFAQTELAADGIGNLISLLNGKATLPAGAKIVQATYVSSEPAVLPNTDRFVPKGDFLKEGHTNVALKQVKLYLDGTTFTIDVHIDLSVTVSHLPPAVDVVDYLKQLTGHGMLSAMHHDQSYANPATNDVLHQRVANEFGVYPALYSADFLTGGTVPYRQNMIDEVKRQWESGSLVQIMFHVSPPQYTVAQEAEGGWGGDTAPETLPSPNRIFSYLYNDQWKELLTDGSELNRNWKLRMDEYAKYLQQLEGAGVTVMLRPFHEMNQHVFWWGGRPGPEGSAALYRMFHDYMEKEKGLTNIIWVWNIQDLPDDYGYADGDAKFDRYEGLDGGLAEYDANDWNSFNPGKDYYDILSVDFYDPLGYQQRHYEQARRIAAADGKPMIIGETFVFPSQDEQAAQPDWTLAMPWGIRTWNYNTKEAMATFYQHSIGIEGMPRFTTRDNSKPVQEAAAPAWPAGAALTASDTTQTGVRLSWPGATSESPLAGYAVYNGQTLLGETSVGAAVYDVSGLAAGTAYTFTVKAKNEAGKWSEGLSVNVTTLSDTTTPPVDPGPGTVTPPAGNEGTTVTGGTIAVTAKPDAQGNVAITLNAGDVKKAVDGAKGGRLQIAIDTGAASIAGTATVKLPLPDILNAANGIGEIAVSANGATIVVRTDAGLLGANAQQLTLTIAKADSSALPADAKGVIGGRPAYELGLTVDGVKPMSFGTGGAVSVTLDYKPQAGEQAHKLVVYNIADDGTLHPVKRTKADASAGKITFAPQHFSRYAVGYADVSFADLSKAAWAQEAIEALAARQIAKGTGADKFEPARAVTRAEFLQLLLEALDLKDASATASFDDVAADAWYYGAVATGAKLGIVKGRADGTFGASDTITREDMAVMLSRAFAQVGTKQGAGSATGKAFADQSAIAGYALNAVNELSQAGLINGFTDGTFAPKGQATRAQAAQVIYKLLQQ